MMRRVGFDFDSDFSADYSAGSLALMAEISGVTLTARAIREASYLFAVIPGA